jgi:hypothetical protein
MQDHPPYQNHVFMSLQNILRIRLHWTGVYCILLLTSCTRPSDNAATLNRRGLMIAALGCFHVVPTGSRNLHDSTLLNLFSFVHVEPTVADTLTPESRLLTLTLAPNTTKWSQQILQVHPYRTWTADSLTDSIRWSVASGFTSIRVILIPNHEVLTGYAFTSGDSPGPHQVHSLGQVVAHRVSCSMGNAGHE